MEEKSGSHKEKKVKKSILRKTQNTFDDRNPAFLSGKMKVEIPKYVYQK